MPEIVQLLYSMFRPSAGSSQNKIITVVWEISLCKNIHELSIRGNKFLWVLDTHENILP